ncbi:MAG: sugar O-acetyltransferase [Ruminococcaceae bacterium]|nr:sugar O-acetyltransferase [Oscillospiraceae bacterium]
MTVYEKMKSGQLYYATDESLLSVQAQCLELQYEYNLTRPTEGQRRRELMERMFAEVGEGTYIEPPLHANWAGRHVHLGKDVYFNFNVTLVDDNDIYIADNTMIGPNTVIATAGHPVCPDIRQKGGQFNIPVHIGKNCWLGAGVIVLPGVTIGDNTVVGAGSVVTKDLPANVVAAGNPCRILRTIGERDMEYYYKDKKIADCDLT